MTDTALSHTLTPHAVETLRAGLAGTVLRPGEAGFADATLAWNRAMVHDPSLVVTAEDAGDVALVVRFAAEHGLGLGVQATGHGMVRGVDGGILLRTHLLDGVVVDPAARTAWVEGGATWAPVLEAAQRHGLAPLLGSAPHVGAVGYTLGGGLGWLARRYGPAADHVRQFRVVVPDGSTVTASPEQHPALFHALCGGGGGTLGVVIGMEVELFPVGVVYGGSLMYAPDQATDIVAAWAAWVEDVPDELTSEVILINYPPMPELPDEIRGRSFVTVRGCWCGPADEGAALLDTFRRRFPPLLDTWAPMPFGDVGTISADPEDPLPGIITGGWMRGVDTGVANTLAAATFPAEGPPPLLFTEIRHVGGAVARDQAGSVMGHRSTPFLFHALGLAFTPEMGDAARAAQAGLRHALVGALTGGAYLNFLDGEERRARARDALAPGERPGLEALQRALDPDGLLRYGVDHTA